MAVLSEPENELIATCTICRNIAAMANSSPWPNYCLWTNILATVGGLGFYAESVSLVEFLSKEKGTTVFIQFMRTGCKAAMRGLAKGLRHAQL